MWLYGFHGADAGSGSADPAAVVCFRMAGSGDNLGGSNADTVGSTKDRLNVNSTSLALEAASLHWMVGDKKIPLRTSLTMHAK